MRSAALVALFLGTLSLVVGILRWENRRFLDLEIILGFLDSLVVLTAGVALLRGSRLAPRVLLALVVAGSIYFIWQGTPWYGMIPQFAAGFFYARAIGALRYLDMTAGPEGTQG